MCTCSVSIIWKMYSMDGTEETTYKGNLELHKITTKNKYKPQRLKTVIA